MCSCTIAQVISIAPPPRSMSDSCFFPSFMNLSFPFRRGDNHWDNCERRDDTQENSQHYFLFFRVLDPNVCQEHAVYVYLCMLLRCRVTPTVVGLTGQKSHHPPNALSDLSCVGAALSHNHLFLSCRNRRRLFTDVSVRHRRSKSLKTRLIVSTSQKHRLSVHSPLFWDCRVK